MASLQPIESVAEGVEKLGGLSAVGQLTGRPSQAVSNWRKTRFPANTYLVLRAALNAAGYDAPPHLWGMVSPPVAAEPARATL